MRQNEQKPCRVWFRFEREVVLAKIGFSTPREAGLNGKHPVKFNVIGADKCEDKTMISINKLFVQDAKFNDKLDEAKSWMIPMEKRQPHLCWGFKFYLSKGNETVAAQNVLMWEARVWN